MLKNFFIFIFLPLFLVILFFVSIIFFANFEKNTGLAAENIITITINPTVVKNTDFAQLLGGYIMTRTGLDPSSRLFLSQSSVIEAAKKMYPQSPEFPKPVVLRTQSFHMLANDHFAITDEEVEDVIKFCSQANCDPMFGALGEGGIQTRDGITGKIIDVSAAAIKKRAEFVKAKCRQYFGDDKHCLNWNIGNEPPSPEQHCDFYGTSLIPTAVKAIREVIPNAIFHAPELYNDSTRIRYWDQARQEWVSGETIGECIAKKLQSSAPDLKLNVFTTHWYPYVCRFSDTALNVDGNAVLNWNGFGNSLQPMTYPFGIVSGMSSWMKNYNATKNAVIGVGELNPMAACHGLSAEKEAAARVTRGVNSTWGGAFWHLDILGIMGDAGIKYVQNHVHTGISGDYSVMVISGNKVIKAPPYYAYSFYSQHFGRTLVESKSSNPTVLNSHASLDKDGNIRVILINKSGGGSKAGVAPANGPAAAKKVRINISNFNAGNIGETYKMTAPINFIQGGAISDNFETERNVPVGNIFEYTVAPYTATIIKIPTSIGLVTPAPDPVDTTPPSTPANLSANAVSSSQINLSWTASTDNVGVIGYRIYRCQGAGCTPTTQIATTATNSYQNTGLSTATTYVYAVSAYDAAGNESTKSSHYSVATQPIGAKVYYVSSSAGNDAWNGLAPAWDGSSGPWKTISKVNSRSFLPGDSILFKRGDTWFGTRGDYELNPPNSGTPEHPIIFGAFGTGDMPKFDGNGMVHWGGFISINGKSWVTIQDLEVTNSQKELISIRAPSTGVTIQNCLIHSNTMRGYMTIFVDGNNVLNGVTQLTITGNTIHTAQWNGMRLARGVTNSTISNNIIYNCIHHGIDFWRDAGDRVCENITISGNKIFNNPTGIYCPNMNNSTIEDNDIFNGIDTGGVGFVEGIKMVALNGHSPTGNTIKRNRIWGMNLASSITSAIKVQSTVNCNIWHNTYYANYSGFLNWGGNINLSYQNNLPYNNTRHPSEPDYGQDPKFVSPASNPPNFRLQSNSPCIDKGVYVGLPYSGIAPDLGAYEYMENSDTTPPSAPTGVVVN